MPKWYEDDVAEMIDVEDFAFSISHSGGSFSAIFEYAYGEQFGFADREVPTLTSKTSTVSSVSAGDQVTVPAEAIPTSATSKTYLVLVKKPDNTGVTVLVLESV